MSNPPAFAFDLTKGALLKGALISGLQRFGKAPGSIDDDTRPLGLDYDLIWQLGPTGTELSPLVSGAALVPRPAFGGLPSLGQHNALADTPVSFRSAFKVPSNGGWTLRAFLHTWPKNQLIKLHQWIWGVPGAGWLFQIRNETAEIASLSLQYNDADMGTLRILWGLKTPSDAERAQIAALIKKLFFKHEPLSFEKSAGRGKWLADEFTLTFIAEPRGVLHIVAEGMDAVTVEHEPILKTRQPGILWPDTPLTLWSGGGAFFFTLGYPQFRTSATIDYGPFPVGYWVGIQGALTYSYNVSAPAGSVQLGWLDMDPGITNPALKSNFGFRVSVANPNPRQNVWIYGLSARLAPTARDGSATVTMDTDALPVPANPATPYETGNPIMDIEPTWDGQTGKRSAKITMRDVNGWTSGRVRFPAHRVADLSIGGTPFITNGLVKSVKRGDVASLIANTSTVFSSRPNTALEIMLCDGWAILDECACEPPPIGDGKTLGAHICDFLALAGFKTSEMAGVDTTGGRLLPRAAAGEDFAQRVDAETTAGDAIRRLLENYGLRRRFYQDASGVWQLTWDSTTSAATFSSDASRNSPLAEPGRLAIRSPLDITHDAEEFFNHFVVVGGEKGELIQEWTDWDTIRRDDVNHPRWIGRKLTKRIHNTALRTLDDVAYTLRSLRWMHGRSRRQTGRRAQYVSYFHQRFWPGALITADGGLWEVTGLSGGSWAKDTSQWQVMELTSN